MNANDVVIVSTARTALSKSFRGSFNDTEAPVLGGHVVRAVVERAGIEPGAVGDVIMGAAAQQLFVFQRTPSSVDVRNNHETDPAWAASLRGLARASRNAPV